MSRFGLCKWSIRQCGCPRRTLTDNLRMEATGFLPRLSKARFLGAVERLCFGVLSLVSLGRIARSLFLCSGCVIASTYSLLVLIYCAIPLAGDIEDFAEVDVRPYLGPFRVEVAIDG